MASIFLVFQLLLLRPGQPKLLLPQPQKQNLQHRQFLLPLQHLYPLRCHQCPRPHNLSLANQVSLWLPHVFMWENNISSYVMFPHSLRLIMALNRLHWLLCRKNSRPCIRRPDTKGLHLSFIAECIAL